MSTDVSTTADLELLRGSVRSFLASRGDVGAARAAFGDRAGVTPDVWDGLAALDVVGLGIPERYGGAGAPFEAVGVVAEELGRSLFSGPYRCSAVEAAGAVLAVGTDEERSELLAPLASGARTASLALFEPGAGHEWRQPATRAEPAGGRWALNGTKMFVDHGDTVDLLLVVAAAPDGVGLFALERPAVTTVPLSTIDPTARLAAVELEHVTARRLGAGDVTVALSPVVDRAAVALVADALGAAGRALELATAYAKERIAFGRPIGSYQAVQHLLADMLRNVELCRVGVRHALRAADGDPSDAHRAAAMVKGFASDALYRVTADAIQVFGGIGYTWDHDAHLFYKRVMSMQAAFGGSDENLEEYARLLLGT